MQLVNILITVILAFIGAQLGNWLEKPQDNLTILYWVLALVLHQLYIQYLIKQNDDLSNDVQLHKDKISSLLILKKTDGTKTYNISLHTNAYDDKFHCAYFRSLKVYITAPFSSNDLPDLEIRSESRFEIKVGNDIIVPKQHANKYVYFISREKLNNTYRSKKYFMYDLQIQARDIGANQINFIAESKDLKAETAQVFDCV